VSSIISIKSYIGKYTVSVYDTEQCKNARSQALEKLSCNTFLVIDRKVASLYPEITEYWSDNNIHKIDALESNKELATCEILLKKLNDASFKKNMKLVAIGGGIIQDITSFTASILYRGVDWIFIPTTLLAQADSCIGSKTSINFNGAKNILGNFYPPMEVYCFTDFLSSLSKNDIKSGIGEILHYYIVDNSQHSKEIIRDYDKILENPGVIYSHILESLSIKKRMIEIDEFDKKQRRIFNYGHTFGHAIEVLSDFKISHGQAVTLGMDIANFVSFSLGMIPIERYKSLCEILSKNIPIFRIESKKIDDFIRLLQKDKKSIKDNIVCILPVGDSDVSVITISHIDTLRSLIKEYTMLSVEI